MQPMLAYCPVAILHLSKGFNKCKVHQSASRCKVFCFAASHLLRRGYRTVCLTTWRAASWTLKHWMDKHVPAQVSRLGTCSGNCLRNAFLSDTRKTCRILQDCGNSLKLDICASETIFTATEGFTPRKQGQVAWAASETPKDDAYRVKNGENSCEMLWSIWA